MEFESDEPKNAENVKKHGVSFEEAELAFDDEYGIERFDEFNSDEEIRYRLIALSPVVCCSFHTPSAKKKLFA